LLLQQRKLLLWIMITTKEFYDAWKQFVLATKIVSAWNMNHGGPSNVQVVDDFLEEPSRPKHMQNWQQTATTSEETGSRAVMESPYCMACFVWKGVLRAPALQGRFGAGSEVSIDRAKMQ
jgi:hypothetical protein